MACVAARGLALTLLGLSPPLGECSLAQLEAIKSLHPESLISCEVQFTQDVLDFPASDIFAAEPVFDAALGESAGLWKGDRPAGCPSGQTACPCVPPEGSLSGALGFTVSSGEVGFLGRAVAPGRTWLRACSLLGRARPLEAGAGSSVEWGGEGRPCCAFRSGSEGSKPERDGGTQGASS